LSQELPLVIQHVNAGHPLKVYKPINGAALDPAHEYLIATVEDLEKVPLPLLCRLYNQANSGMNVNNFKPGTIIKYCLPALQKLVVLSTASAVPVPAAPAVAQPAPSTEAPQGEVTVAKTEAAVPTPEKKAAEKKTSVRTPEKFAGKTIVPKVSENPRRDGTRGHQSFEVILNGHKASSHHGISYEKFVEGGGRAQDLAWDVEKGNAELR
jgi:hypothetical protein